jgi:hypothetical protein
MFDLTSAEDFYTALVSDFDDLMAEPHSARRALHCAMTAYHLHEWVWGDWLKRDPATKDTLGIRNFASYVKWLNASCVWFGFVEGLANGGKHFDRDRGFETYRVAALPFALDQPNAGLDMGAWNGPIRYVGGSLPVGANAEGYLVIDIGEAAGETRWLPATHGIEAVVRFWRDFFRKYRPSETLPVSRHHVD